MKETTTTMESSTKETTKAANTKSAKSTSAKKVTAKKAVTKTTRKKAEDNNTTATDKKTTAKKTLATKTKKVAKKTTVKVTKLKDTTKLPDTTKEGDVSTIITPDTEITQAENTTKTKSAIEHSAEKEATKEQSPAQIEDTPKEYKPKPESKIPASPVLPKIEIHNIVELAQAPQRSIILTDQQIQQLSLEEIEKRHFFLQNTLANILDYDVVISDTNIWLELLVGHTSSHSDPRINARLQFERQLEFISKIIKYRGGHFIMMSETYEEIDRFACMQDPTNHREADFTDNIVCLNAAARLAKRLILSQQRENRLQINNIGAESHHAAFADPAIIRCVAECFSSGKKVLLLTNDASVAIRSIGICDDLQRHNNISDQEWNEHYAPLRPMVFTFDDLKLLDFYTRQYHYIQMASGQQWMSEISRSMKREQVTPLNLWEDAFRPGDKHKGDNLFTEQEQKQIQQKQQAKQQTIKKQVSKPINKTKNETTESVPNAPLPVEGNTESTSIEQKKIEPNSTNSSQARKIQNKRKSNTKATRNTKKSPSQPPKTADNA